MRKIIAIFTLSLLIAFAFQPLCLSDVYTNNTLRPISAYEKEERATQYAKVDAGTHKQLLITVSKTIGATLEEQTRNACDQIRRVLEKEGVSQDFIAEQVVYMADASRRTACKDVMKKYFYGKTLPATAFIQQPPANGDQISIQLTVMYGDGVKVSRKNDNVTVVTDRARNKKICVQGVESRDHLKNNLYDQALDALLRVEGLVKENGASLDNMIRAWHYIDGITDSVDGVQPYQAFNNARWDIYKGLLRGREAVKFGNGCIRLDEDGHPIPENVWLPPAATGIGTSGGARFVFGCTILVPADPAKTTLRFLANKKQVSAHSYPPDQLVGGVRPPQFSRGIDEELEAGANSETFVSGTASITKAISRYTDPREAVRQTLLTIHNMGIVLLAAKGQPPALGAVLDERLKDAPQITVYIKRQSDYPKIREIVRRKFPDACAVFLIADVCRSDLWVEIEARAFTQKSKKETSSTEISKPRTFTIERLPLPEDQV